MYKTCNNCNSSCGSSSYPNPVCNNGVFYSRVIRAGFRIETNVIKPLKCNGEIIVYGTLIVNNLNQGFEVITIDGSYQLTQGNTGNVSFIASDGNNTVLLPTDLPTGSVYNIINDSSSTSELIVGDQTLLQGTGVELIFNNNNEWVPLNSYHSEDFNNPYHTTKAQVGLSEVINCKQVCESSINQPNGVAGLNYLGQVSDFRVPRQLVVEQYTYATLADSASQIILHSRDANNRRLIQVYSGIITSQSLIEYNRLTEEALVEEDSTKTTFENDVVALEQNITESNVQNSYLFNDSNNRLKDSSGSNDGTLQGAGAGLVAFPAGIAGQAINFSPASAEPLTVLELGNLDVQSPNATTFAVWFNLANISGDSHILSKSNNDSLQNYYFTLGVNSSANPFVRLRIDSGTSVNTQEVVITSVTVATGSWYHFVVVYDGTNISTYVSQSGVNVSPQLRDTTNAVGNIVQDSGVLVGVGNQPNPAQNGEKFFDGLIDQLLIYNTALALPAITALYNSGTGTSVTAFDTSKQWYVTTGDQNQIDTSNWIELDSVTTFENTPSNTDVRYQISIDGRASWNYWDGSAWQLATLGSLTESNTKVEIEALGTADFNLLFVPGTIDIAVILNSTDPTVTPSVTQFIFNYKINGFTKVSDNDLSISLNSANASTITNNSGGPLNNLKVNILIPQ